jgi:hypothetical protein
MGIHLSKFKLTRQSTEQIQKFINKVDEENNKNIQMNTIQKRSNTINTINTNNTIIPNYYDKISFYNAEVVNKFPYFVKYSHMKELFISHAHINETLGYFVTFDRFNEVIAAIFKFDIPILCHSFLSERLYQLMEKNNVVGLADFMEGIKHILLSDDVKTRISFEVMRKYDSKSNNVNTDQYGIPFNDIVEYFSYSWKSGLYLLYTITNQQCKGELISNGILVPGKGDLDFLITKYKYSLVQYLIDSFSKFNINLSQNDSYQYVNIPFDIFKKWIYLDHDLEITYYNKRIKIAVSLLCLRNVGLLVN